MQERLIGGGVAAAIFLPLLFIGGLPFQLLVGAMAMVAVSEMLRMKHFGDILYRRCFVYVGSLYFSSAH